MIFIDVEEVKLKIKPTWLAAARDVKKLLSAAATAKERKRIIDDNSHLWRELKTILASVSHLKCWYCETRDHRSDNAVDHYRPKSRVAGEHHPGYWWLAFDSDNFRFACTYCNSWRNGPEGTAGGKQDYFPILAGSIRAVGPESILSEEVPLLIDPCSATDVALLWFDETGQASGNPHGMEFDSAAKQKVTESIKYYHLDHVPLVEARRRIYAEVLKICDDADKANKWWNKSREQSAYDGYREAMGRLARSLKRENEYSAVALCAIRGYRATSDAARIAFEYLNR
ncbi:HNH endonuclease [Streptomyces sp. NPDC002387]|uniref:HNH endonuclease n=1 Tax=Streptomyces sp. NPDC002387 TaxID=3364643 RepID=UPI00368EB8B5